MTIDDTIVLTKTSGQMLLFSSVIGTQRTLDISGASTKTFTYIDFKDINIATGGADIDLSASSSGDCGGNDGITFTTAVDQHWQNADGGNWSLSTNWTSRTPLPQDDVYMDKAFNASKTVTQNMPRAGKSIDWTGATGTTTWTTSTAASIFGSLTLTDTFDNVLFAGSGGLFHLVFGAGVIVNILFAKLHGEVVDDFRVTVRQEVFDFVHFFI
jgi:hypothetical protein